MSFRFLLRAPNMARYRFMTLCFFLFTAIPIGEAQGAPVTVELTLVDGADAKGAVCLDGSLPGYHLDRGSGTGSNRWIVHLQGGGWCSDASSCAERTVTSLGSSKFMGASTFVGILSNSPDENPYFYNWNRVKVRYCDGGSFAGNVDTVAEGRVPGTPHVRPLYYRGQNIWEAVMDELLRIGMTDATQAILSGESAGGLAALIHCNDFRDHFYEDVDVRCISDGGLFLDISDIDGSQLAKSYFEKVADLQNIGVNLPQGCTSARDPRQCFLPQYFLEEINCPTFILQSAYDTYQLRTFVIPPSEDPTGIWASCENDPEDCTADQGNVLQEFRKETIRALSSILNLNEWGVFLISCFYHAQSQDNFLWNGPSKVAKANAMTAIGKWAYDGVGDKYIDAPYPSNPTCR